AQRAHGSASRRAARGARARGPSAPGLRRHAQLASVLARDPRRDGRRWPPPRGRADPVGVPLRGVVGALRGRRRPRARDRRRRGHARWLLAYQSRSGGPRDPWLEPDVGEAIRDLAKAGERRVVLAPIGFVVDHVEVLYDLDTEARAVAAQHGVAYHRAAAVND